MSLLFALHSLYWYTIKGWNHIILNITSDNRWKSILHDRFWTSNTNVVVNIFCEMVISNLLIEIKSWKHTANNKKYRKEIFQQIASEVVRGAPYIPERGESTYTCFCWNRAQVWSFDLKICCALRHYAWCREWLSCEIARFEFDHMSQECTEAYSCHIKEKYYVVITTYMSL